MIPSRSYCLAIVVSIFSVLCLTVSQVQATQDEDEASEALSEKIYKPDPNTMQMSAQLHYAGTAIVVTHDSGVAVFDFLEVQDDGEGVSYRYRLYQNDGTEVSGKSEVVEKYTRKKISENEYEVIDNGSVLFLEAGQIRIQWSMSNADSGWTYFMPEDYTVQQISEKYYKDLVLKRFR